MTAFKCCRSAAVAALTPALALGSCGAAAAERTQVELTCLLATANLLGDDAQSSSEGAGREALPGERLLTRRTAAENRARLELSTVEPGFLAGVEAEARLRLELLLDPLGAGAQPAWRDASSWLGVAWRPSAGARLVLRAFPLDTDYERLGYLHALDWGGTDVARAESIFIDQKGGVPGLELAAETPRARVAAGLRWTQAGADLDSGNRLGAVVLSGQLQPGRELSIDSGLGYFQRPAQGAFASPGTRFLEGASLRLVWHRGISEPELAPEPFRPPSLRDEPLSLAAPASNGAAVALELVALAERRQRFEVPQRSALMLAPAAALYGSVRRPALAGYAALIWRSLPFVTRNLPGLVPGQTLPLDLAQRAELAAWVGGSITSLPARLVPSLELGVLLPAAVEGPSSLPGYPQTFIVALDGQVQALPVGGRRLPSLAVRAGLRFQVSPVLALALSLDYTRDPNRVRFGPSPLGSVRTFANPDRAVMVGAAQARF